MAVVVAESAESHSTTGSDSSNSTEGEVGARWYKPAGVEWAGPYAHRRIAESWDWDMHNGPQEFDRSQDRRDTELVVAVAVVVVAPDWATQVEGSCIQTADSEHRLVQGFPAATSH